MNDGGGGARAGIGTVSRFREGVDSILYDMKLFVAGSPWAQPKKIDRGACFFGFCFFGICFEPLIGGAHSSLCRQSQYLQQSSGVKTVVSACQGARREACQVGIVFCARSSNHSRASRSKWTVVCG